MHVSNAKQSYTSMHTDCGSFPDSDSELEAAMFTSFAPGYNEPVYSDAESDYSSDPEASAFFEQMILLTR